MCETATGSTESTVTVAGSVTERNMCCAALDSEVPILNIHCKYLLFCEKNERRGEEKNTDGVEGRTSHSPWVFSRFGLGYWKCVAFMGKTGSKTRFTQIFRVNMLEFMEKIGICGGRKIVF